MAGSTGGIRRMVNLVTLVVVGTLWWKLLGYI
jgi:hypothetical protein